MRICVRLRPAPTGRVPVLALLVLLVLGWASSASFAANRRNVRFERISPADGLSQAFVQCAIQDRRGFLWFGTQEGLNRYDGYAFRVYAHNPGDPNSLPMNSVKAVVEDHRGMLWIGTRAGGLSRFDPTAETFQHFRHDPGNPDSLSGNDVETLYFDSTRHLWVGTEGGGLSVLDVVSGTFRRIELSDSPGLSIRSIFEDSEGTFWIGTEQSGLFRYDTNSDTSRQYLHDPASTTSLSDNRVMAVHEDRRGDIWIATFKGGLNRLDPATGTFERFRKTTSRDGLPSDTVRAIFEDRRGTLWFGTDAGLAEWLPEAAAFTTYVHRQTDPYTLSHNSIVSIMEDRGGVLWVGTFSGLNKWNRATEGFRHFRHSATDRTQLSNGFVTSFAPGPNGGTYVGTYGGGVRLLDPKTDEFTSLRIDSGPPATDPRVTSLYTDRSGVLWIGSRSAGLDRYDPVGRRITSYRADPTNPRALSAPAITSMLEDDEGRLWIGTYRGGLNILDPRTGEFEHFRHDPNDPTSISSDRVVSLYEDREGRMWIGTAGGGLNLWDSYSERFVAYRHLENDPNSLLRGDVLAIAEDEVGNLWLGTNGGGLNLWTAENRSLERPIFQRITRADGLNSNVIHTILIDDSGSLWLSTNRGLTRFDPSDRTMVHYDESHGLQSNEFNFPAAFKASDGELFFGGINGFNAFYADGLAQVEYNAPIVLTEARIAGERTETTFAGAMIESVEIGPTDRFFEFEFAALDYAAPSRTRYRYRLEGLESRWVDLRTRRRIAYANLDPGTYTLRVSASNYDGSWNPNELAVVIHVSPTLWASYWAKAAYALALGALLLLGHRAYRARIDRAREFAAANKARELAETSSRTKSQFLANMSHEIRTPLNGVLGMLELLLRSDLNRSQRRFATTAGRSANHLLNLLNDVLDLSKIEAGRLSLERAEFDLRQLCEEVVELFAENAQRKGLELFHQIPEGTPTVYYGDPTRLRQVLGNLVGNAIKFTERGHVLLACSAHVSEDEGTAELLFTIEDTGIGMETETRDRVFQTFQQADGSTTRKYGGTGLGLSISKQLVEMMGGEIWVESVTGVGSRFRFSATLEMQPGATDVVSRPVLPEMTALIAHRSPIGAGILEDTLRDWGLDTHRIHTLTRLSDDFRGMDAEFFDLAIIDVELVREENLEISEALKPLPFETRTALLTPTDFEDEEEAMQAGTEVCLHKPLRRADLLRFARGDDGVVLEESNLELDLSLEDRADPAHTPQVLVVEDNPTNQTVVSAMLDSLGLRNDVADDGEAAVEAVASGDYDLVLMDCQMPKMDGFAASRSIRATESGDYALPIVAMTASAMSGDRERCEASGMNDYLSKPFDRDQLIRVLKRHLELNWVAAPSSPSEGETDGEAAIEPPLDDALLDPRPLEVIRSLSPEDGDELVATVIESFLEDTPQILSRMREGLDAGEAQVLQQMGHRLKSAAANLGANELSSLSRQLEVNAREGELEGAAELVGRIETAFERTRGPLNEKRNRAA